MGNTGNKTDKLGLRITSFEPDSLGQKVKSCLNIMKLIGRSSRIFGLYHNNIISIKNIPFP